MARKSKNKKSNNIFVHLLQGRLLSVSIFTKYWSVMLFVILIIVAQISSKYQYQNQLDEISSLENSLRNVETENMDARARYNTQIREINLNKLVDTMRLDLKLAERPAYVVKD